MPRIRQFRDEFGRKSQGYHHVKYGKTERDDTVINIERSLVRHCERKGIDFGTCNKFAMIRKLFGRDVYREYARALAGPRRNEINFTGGR